MSLAFWCVLVAGLLPHACSYLAKFGPRGGSTAPDRAFDNREPRAWLKEQTGPRARADAAQQNSWEAFPFFAVGVVVATLQRVPMATIDVLAVVFIAARLAYVVIYIAGGNALRSLVWLVGFGASAALYLAAAVLH